MEQINFFATHEADMSRMERINRRLWILCIILIVTLLGTNAGWLYYESQFVEESTTVEQEVDTGDGEATVIGVGGDYYGEGKTDGNDHN